MDRPTVLQSLPPMAAKCSSGYGPVALPVKPPGALLRPRPPAPSPSVERRRHVANAVSGLGGMAPKVALVLAEAGGDSRGLQDLGFASVATRDRLNEASSALEDLGSAAKSVLIVGYGMDVEASAECCRALDESAKKRQIPRFVLAIIRGEKGLEASQRAGLVKACLDSGADDVMLLFGAERLTGLRVQEAVVRTAVMARRTSAMISDEVAAVKKRAAKRLQESWKQFIWDLPGNVLENIPAKQDDVDESDPSEDDAVVGGYVLKNQLGAGAFGTVFKAEHPSHGTCALKVMPKEKINNIGQLLSADSEVCIMRHLPPHPHVARAHDVFHKPEGIVLAMDYCGPCDLQSFIAQSCQHTGEACLPREDVNRFCKHEAAGLAHLHKFMVCHRDLKPANFVVSSDGSSLRLTDFGLAAMSCGPGQLHLRCCGSMPFVAPEVLRLQHASKAEAVGYNGLAADIWSLAVNFMELGYGLYSMERVLGWLMQKPTQAQQLKGMEDFIKTWKKMPEMCDGTLKRVMDKMFVLQPGERWTIRQVAGEEGLRIGEDLACPTS